MRQGDTDAGLAEFNALFVFGQYGTKQQRTIALSLPSFEGGMRLP